jgi:hypothetical protein
MPGVGTYDPGFTPVARAPGRRAHAFGNPDRTAAASGGGGGGGSGGGGGGGGGALDARGSTPAAIGPGSYNPPLPHAHASPVLLFRGGAAANGASGSVEDAFLPGRDPARYHLPERTRDTTPAGSGFVAYSFGRGFEPRKLDADGKQAVLERSRTQASIVASSVTPEGQRLRRKKLERSFRERDERLELARSRRGAAVALEEKRRNKLAKQLLFDEMDAQLRGLPHATSSSTSIELGASRSSTALPGARRPVTAPRPRPRRID